MLPLPPGWHDVSPLVSPRTAVFPGDQPYAPATLLSFAAGDALALTTLHTTPHVGAHCDAPCHYVSGGAGIAQRSLQRYIGDAQVISVTTPAGDRIQVGDLAELPRAPRILLRTQSFPDPERWTDAFCSLAVELVHFLADRGAVLVGIDTPSIDPAAAKILQAHHAVAERDLAILEGIDLRGVPDGDYTLLALPLRLDQADASPVRAVLVPRIAQLETLGRGQR